MTRAQGWRAARRARSIRGRSSDDARLRKPRPPPTYASAGVASQLQSDRSRLQWTRIEPSSFLSCSHAELICWHGPQVSALLRLVREELMPAERLPAPAAPCQPPPASASQLPAAQRGRLPVLETAPVFAGGIAVAASKQVLRGECRLGTAALWSSANRDSDAGEIG